jgi:hypothetical protein
MPTNSASIDGSTVLQFSTKETAQAIREALTIAFPRVKFSVRTQYYSMGSSTHVRWTDGPTEPEVDRVLDRFSSRTFDGMTDSTQYHMQEWQGQLVSYSGWITTRREISPDLRALAERKAAIMGEDNVDRLLHTMRPNGCRVTLK